jgi:aryl-alcohol dehydrogenase-like predicted oxidoreductase
MKMRTLGRTGIKVSPYCLGTMMFGLEGGNPDHDDCVKIIHRAIDAGINFIDTADVYAGGASEVIVGKAIKDRRDDVVLSTKVNGAMGSQPNRSGSSRRWIIHEVEQSLRRLGVDHIDLYQLYHPDPDTDIEESLSALTDLVRSGKVRAIGASNFTVSEIIEAQWVAQKRGLERPRTEQPPYSILNRGIEREVLPTCQRYGMGTLVWSPLAMGMLAGKYRKGQATNSPRMHWVPKHLTDEHTLNVVEDLITLATGLGTPIAHLAKAFAMSHPGVTSAIIGPRTMDQLENLLAGASLSLDDDVLDQIDALVPPGADIGPLDVAHRPASITTPELRRRPHTERTAS